MFAADSIGEDMRSLGNFGPIADRLFDVGKTESCFGTPAYIVKDNHNHHRFIVCEIAAALKTGGEDSSLLSACCRISAGGLSKLN